MAERENIAMWKRPRRGFALSVALFLFVVSAGAQEATYKFDIGAGAGITGYLGDVNQTNMFRNPGFAARVGFGYQIDTRWALRGIVNAGGTSGDASQFTNKFPAAENYTFKSTIYGLDVRGEFNFLPYGTGETFKRLKRWTPYIAAGIGGVLSSTSGQLNGAFTIPLAAGFKFKLRERLNLAAEFSMTKTFADKLDGEIADLQGIKSSFAKNTDWYSNITISLSYEFGKRCETCHYQK